MAGKVRHFDFHFSEWLAGTRGLGFGTTAVYITVIAIAGDRGGLCPNDASYIAGQIVEPGTERQALSGATRLTRHALARLVELGKLHISADGQWLTNGRADIELNKARERINGATRAGIASGQARRARARTATSQPHHSHIAATPVSKKTNGLARTSVRNLQPYESSLSESLTDAAREPSPEPQASQARAHTGPEVPLPPTPFEGEAKPPTPAPKTADRLAALAAQARAKLLKGGGG
jgi:hypothetical protein